ncbi:MAG: YbaY family lipoprotein [Bryobacteraceae bacterium]
MRVSSCVAQGLIVFQLLLGAGCAHRRPAAKPVAARIIGTVTYLQRIALPPEATIEVTFADVSIQDTAPIQLGNQVIKAAGKQVPIPFAIGYDSRQIVSSHTYGVEAKIKVGERLMFASDSPNLVLTQGRPTNVEIIVKAVPAPK